MLANDPLLRPFLDTTGDDARRRAMETLVVERVRPLVARILARYRAVTLTDADVEDLTATIDLKIVGRLQQLSAAPDEAIERLDDYVATLAYNVVYTFLRTRYPERTRLKNRLRYLFTHDAELTLWETDDGSVCGLKSWEGRAPLTQTAALRNIPLDRDSPATAMRALLRLSNAPLLLDDIVRIAAAAWGVFEVRIVDGAYERESRDSDPESLMIAREEVELLWNEVLELPPKQRAALLLNLRDAAGRNALEILVFTNIASIDAIANATGITPEKLSEIWNELPLNDKAIASTLGQTRQQIINLRKSARERLARRIEWRRRP